MQRQNNPILVENSYENQHESLAAAFAFFNETSQQLAQSYHMLEKRVQQLTSELDQVSEEKEQAHQNKQKIASRMQALLDFLPGGVIVLDANGYIIDANPAAEELLQSKLEGCLWRETIRECFAPQNDDGLEISTHSGRRISLATSSLGNDGQIILLTDQTETRKLQQNVSRNEKLSAMGKMVSALAHQIRTPLSAALLYASHLCKEDVSQEKKCVFSEKLLGRLQHMEKQVRDMMLFVKSELPLNDIISLNDLEIGLREAAEVAIATVDAVCQWKNTHPTKKIKCHREALISMLMNLINNGIQACEREVALIVEISCIKKDVEDFVQIKVRDNGQGMKKDALQEVQQMFVTTKVQGTGLGLSVVKSVVRAHGGYFDLTSQLDIGTTATIEIPVFENN